MKHTSKYINCKVLSSRYGSRRIYTDLFKQCDHIFCLSEYNQSDDLLPYEKSRTVFFIFLEEVIQKLMRKNKAACAKILRIFQVNIIIFFCRFFHLEFLFFLFNAFTMANIINDIITTPKIQYSPL